MIISMKKYLKYIITIIILFALGWVPLVGAYDYEAALCVALAGLVFIPIWAPRSPKQTMYSLSLSFVSAFAFWIAANLMMLAVAAIRGQICDIAQGFEYQVLIAFPGNLLAALVWGWISRFCRFRIVQCIVYILAICLDLGIAGFALYQWPPLVAFGQFFGYFAGSIYDESIDVTRALIFWRIGTVALCLCLWFAQTPSAKLVRKIVFPIVGIVIALGYHWVLAQSDLLIPIGREALKDTLWATVQSADKPFTVHYVPKSKSRLSMAKEKARIFADFSKNYTELQAFFHAQPVAPIDIWIYPDRELKGKFMGAKNTSFARVWKNEIHLIASSPDSTLAKHEMAHLFAGAFGVPPFMVAGGGHIPAIGWIEGLAMAAEWPQNTFDLHTWSNAIFQNEATFGEIRPHGLLYGFWGMPSRVAYTLAGSWVRWLIDKYGIEKVKQLSRGMPGDFSDIIGVDFIDSFEQWKQDIHLHHHNEKAIQIAPMLFGSASIWNKKCARARASQEAQWYRCLKDEFCAISQTSPWVEACTGDCKIDENWSTFGDLEKLWQFYMMRGPLDTVRIKTLGNSLEHASAYTLRAVIYRLYSQIPEDKHTAASRIIWRERFADMAWQAGNDTIAYWMYLAMSMQPMPDTMHRRISIKKQAAQYPETQVSKGLKIWFFSPNEAERTRVLNDLNYAPIVNYLAYINAMSRSDFDGAEHAWSRFVLSLPNTKIESELPASCWHELIRWTKYMNE